MLAKLLLDVQIGEIVRVTEAQIKRDTRARGEVVGKLVFKNEKGGTIWLNDSRVVQVENDCLVEVQGDCAPLDPPEGV